jgi:serine/threonine protein kinase
MSKINENIVHRDIKPSNILIQDDLLKITDFGISKLVDEATRTKTFKGWGSSPYIAPEGWKLKQNSIQMDIYSMGIVFYELATLKYPYKLKEETENDYKEAHLFKAPISPIERNPQISSVIAQVILGMLEKKVEDRFNNWGEIKDFLINGAEENINENPLVENILKDRLAKDEKKEKQNLQKEKRKKEIEDFKREIEFMIKDDIINTLRKIINQLNRKYNKGNIHIGKHNRFSYSIITFDNKRIKIEMSPIIKENFYKDIKYSNHGMTVQKTELRLPEYKNKKIKAWGYIKAPDGRGINLILLPQEEMDMYGKWYMLVNRCSAMYGEKRPTPFPFEFNEIGKEIKQINAVHIYNTDVQPLDINYIVKEFIGKYI